MEQLGVQGDGTATSSISRKGHVRANTWSDSTASAASDNATTLVQSGPFDFEDSERRKRLLGQQRALWESTLPKLPVDHIGYFASAQDLDRIRYNNIL